MSLTTVDAADSVTISDRLGHTYEITMDGVQRLAAEPSRFGAGRVWVEVAGRSLPAVDLIVRLTNADDYLFRLTDLAQALGKLGLKVERRSTQRSKPNVRSRDHLNISARPDQGENEIVPPIFSAATVKAMERFQGRWVGVRADRVVADGDSPRDILEKAQASSHDPVTLLYIPRAHQHLAE